MAQEQRPPLPSFHTCGEEDPPQQNLAWIEWLGKRLWRPCFKYTALPDGCREPIRVLTTSNLDRLRTIITEERLPCEIKTTSERTELIVYQRPTSVNEKRLTVLVRILDSHILRGHLPHPTRGTCGRALLINIAMNPNNAEACQQAGITQRLSLRPPR